MRARHFIVTAALAATAAAAPAPAQQIIADLQDYTVRITTGFAGTDVLLFGAADGEGDVIVTVRGPESDVVVRRKAHVNGMWINTDSVTFSGVPGYYAVASTKPIAQLIGAAVAEREEIGPGYLRFAPEANVAADTVALFRQALIRNMERAELFQPRTATITLPGQRLFKVNLHFPARVPTGAFRVNVYLVRGGQVVSGTSIPLRVDKIGLSAEIYDFAQKRGISYGLIAVAFAGIAGWAASRMFQRG